MRRYIALAITFIFMLQPFAALAETTQPPGKDARLYLPDGTVIEGYLIERTDDLIIMQVNKQVYTFNPMEVDKIVTMDSLGSKARTITVREFPYISFLGGTVAFGLLSWLQFDTASDRDNEADLNQENGLTSRASKLQDKADRARLFGWSSFGLAVGSLGVALYPHKTTRRIFPELSLNQGTPILQLTVRHNF